MSCENFLYSFKAGLRPVRREIRRALRCVRSSLRCDPRAPSTRLISRRLGAHYSLGIIADLVNDLAQQFNLPPKDVATDVRFVLGDETPTAGELDQSQVERIYSYFSSVYGQQGQDHQNSDAEETFTRLVIQDWRQFTQVDIDLSSRLTIITGENGTGKTTILNLLGQAFGESVQFLGTPFRDKDGFRFRAGRRPTGEFEQIGLIGLGSGRSAKLGVREWQGGMQPYFNPELAPYLSLPGLYLDAQRVIGPYQQLESIPPRFKSAREIAQAYREQLRNLWIPHQMVKPPSILIKEALVAAAMYGEGNSMVVGDPQAAKVWKGFQDVLRRLFPQSLGFERLYVDQGELIVDTQSGAFALEAASGGLSAIVTLGWQIYLHAVDSPEAFTVCFDEPENHLHPSLQRTLVPSLVEAFPNVRFVVATHSPFVVTSTREAAVYALRRTGEGLVYSQRINLEDQAFTADEILNEVLGVGVTLPVWAERNLEEIIADFSSAKVQGSLESLISRLEAAGLKISMPDVTEAVAAAIESRPDGSDH